MNNRQTPATKIRSRNFGIAATAAKILRRHLEHQLPYPKDKRMQSQFGGNIAKWLGSRDPYQLSPEQDLGYVMGFAFNKAASIAALWKLPLSVTKENEQLISLHIPGFVPAENILAPAGTTEVECSITAASWNWSNPNLQNSGRKNIRYPYNSTPVPAQDILLPVPASRGCLLITVVSLVFLHQQGEKNSHAWNLPCNVVDARYC